MTMMIIDFMCLYYTSFAGLLKRIKNSRGKKKSLSDLTKFSTLPSMPFRARKPSTNSRSSSSNLLKDERVKSMSESSTCSTLDSDSSSSPILNVCVIFTKKIFFFCWTEKSSLKEKLDQFHGFVLIFSIFSEYTILIFMEINYTKYLFH